MLERTIEEQGKACKEFWAKLVEIMTKKGYVWQPSDTGTTAEYLFREGEESQLSWMGKPKKSFRIGDFWSWYANTETCLAPSGHIQCLNTDFGYVKKRPDPVKGTSPRKGWAVAYTEDGYHYYTIFGRKLDKKTGEWKFITPSVDSVLSELSFV